MPSRLIAACLLALAALVAAHRAGASEGDAATKARASVLVKDGARAFDGGDYTAALARFQEAYAVYASPRIMFNLGQCYQRLGRYVEATESFEGFLAAAGTAPAPA